MQKQKPKQAEKKAAPRKEMQNSTVYAAYSLCAVVVSIFVACARLIVSAALSFAESMDIC